MKMLILFIVLGVCPVFSQMPDLSCSGLTDVAVCENFQTGSLITGSTPGGKDPGLFTPDGWEIQTENSQIMWDLGDFYTKGTVEFYMKGNLRVTGTNEWGPIKKVIFGAWDEEEALDPRECGNDRCPGDSTRYFQIRLMSDAMMLRLTNRIGGGSFEGLSNTVPWEQDRWYHIKGEWNSEARTGKLWLDGVLMKEGNWNQSFKGLRWLFIGADNYDAWGAIPGNTYANLKIHGVEGYAGTVVSRKGLAASNSVHWDRADIHALDGGLIATIPARSDAQLQRAEAEIREGRTGLYIIRFYQGRTLTGVRKSIIIEGK